MLDKVKAKLIATKQKWASEGRLLTGESAEPVVRLPPGQREVKNWPVLDLGILPEVTTANWKLEVEGLVEAPLT
ncbi:MAG: sulfite oxidase-like oxidoreductase, partial [bacterium]